MKSIFYLLVFSLFVISCDEEMVPMKDRTVLAGNKSVLVEDFTGIQCINCPTGARLIESTRTTDELKNRIIPLAIHTLGFDNLFPNSKYQFRTDKGQEMQDYIGNLQGKPTATINRTPSNTPSGLFYCVPNIWPNVIVEELSRPTEINMTMDVQFDAVSRVLNIEVTYIPVNEISAQLNMTAVIAESDLIDPQLDNDGVVEDFVHNHVLRDVISAVTGDGLGTNFDKGGIYSKTYSYTIPPEDGWWVAENCEIIVFISDSDSKRVLQTISTDVGEK